MLGLYIHIPFCNSLCKFCDFPKRIKQNKEYIDLYLKKVQADLNKLLNTNYEFDTVYIGGGTPNSLSLSQLEDLLISILKLRLKANFEFTIEGNFELITPQQISLFKKYGVNRLSLGVQTFNERIGLAINRPSRLSVLKEKLQLIREKGIENINCDFIFGLPNQTLYDVQEDLQSILELDLKHVSYYSLILEEKSVLYYEFNKKMIELPDADLSADMYELIIQTLKQNGYTHYEISNFAKPGFESRHNLLYWSLEEYIGIGMSAASYLNNKRYSNSLLINEYLKDVGITEAISDKGEYFWLGLRMLQGLSISKYIEKFHSNPFDDYQIEELINKGLVYLNNDYLKLTSLGLEHGNYVFEYFI